MTDHVKILHSYYTTAVKLIVWGAGWEKENAAPPKVFRLVGKSADEVRAVACDVSQEGTSTEERVRLNRMQHEMLH